MQSIRVAILNGFQDQAVAAVRLIAPMQQSTLARGGILQRRRETGDQWVVANDPDILVQSCLN